MSISLQYNRSLMRMVICKMLMWNLKVKSKNKKVNWEPKKNRSIVYKNINKNTKMKLTNLNKKKKIETKSS